MPPKTTSQSTPGHAVDAVLYEAMAAFRSALIHYAHASDTRAQAVGLTSRQYSLLIFIGAARDPLSIGDAADLLCLTHHSAVELSQRAEQAGLILRNTDPADSRRVLLSLTDVGYEKLGDAIQAHVNELREHRSALIHSLQQWTRVIDEHEIMPSAR